LADRNVEVIRPLAIIRHHLRIAAIADGGDVDAGEPLEQFEAEMPGGAFAGMAVVQRARIRLRECHVFGHAPHRQRDRHDEEIRRPADLPHGHEIAAPDPSAVLDRARDSR